MRSGARWVVRADDDGEGWRIHAPEPWHPDVHMGVIMAPGDRAVVVGLDVPLGVPRGWAATVGLTSFRDLLAAIRGDRWPHLLEPAATAADIAPSRPFYPRRPGGTRQADLVAGLGLASVDDLRRECDRALPGAMGSAAPVFWLVGAQQVGKAAITAWRDVVAPAAARAHVRLWPMDGALDDLVAPGRTVIAEVYPRAAYAWPLGFPPTGWSKRRQADRRARAAQARQWMGSNRRGITPDRAMQAALDDGFGPAPSGEDPFDATMGALQMIAVLDGLLPEAPRALMDATDSHARATEGWILGRPAS
jgi:hypothetical protein